MRTGSDDEATVRKWPQGSLLDRLPEHLAERLLRHGRSQAFHPGQPILRQGDPERHAIVLLHGVAKVSIVDGRGAEAVMAVRRRGDVVGELAAVSGERRAASVTALTTVGARVVAGSVFAAFLAEHPTAAREVIRMGAQRLRWANSRRAEFARLCARARIARALLELSAVFTESAGSDRIALSQEELASLVGVRLTTAETALRELEECGAVRRGYRSIVVADRRVLADDAGTRW